MGIVVELQKKEKRRGKGGGRGPTDDGRRGWLRRQAAQIVAQLPDDYEEALEVLNCAQQLIEYFAGT
jgi:hypothetical protein